METYEALYGDYGIGEENLIRYSDNIADCFNACVIHNGNVPIMWEHHQENDAFSGWGKSGLCYVVREAHESEDE